MSWQGNGPEDSCGFEWTEPGLKHSCGLEPGHLFEHQCGAYSGVDPVGGGLVRCRAETARE